MTEDQYQQLITVARDVNWRFEVALVLANETGHRKNAIRMLRWADIDFEQAMIRWRGEHEKTGYEHETPISKVATPS